MTTSDLCERDDLPIGDTWLTPPFPLRYRPPASAQDAVKSADANLEYRTQTGNRESIPIQPFTIVTGHSLQPVAESIFRTHSVLSQWAPDIVQQSHFLSRPLEQRPNSHASNLARSVIFFA